MEQQQSTQINADNQVVRRRFSRRLAGLESDPPMEMKKARARRGARSKPNQGEEISSAGSNDQSVEVGERGFPIPKAELFEFPGFGYAYAILTDAIPLPVDLYAPTEPPAQSSDGAAPAPPPPPQQG